MSTAITPQSPPSPVFVDAKPAQRPDSDSPLVELRGDVPPRLELNALANQALAQEQQPLQPVVIKEPVQRLELNQLPQWAMEYLQPLQKWAETPTPVQVQGGGNTAAPVSARADITLSEAEREQIQQMLAPLNHEPELAQKLATALIANGTSPAMLQQHNAPAATVAGDQMAEKSDAVSAAKGGTMIGFANNEMMLLLLSLVAKMRESMLNGELKMAASYGLLSEAMNKMAAKSTIEEGKKMLTGAITGFALSGAMAAGGAALSMRGVQKNWKASDKHLGAAARHTETSNSLRGEMLRSHTPQQNRTVTGRDGSQLRVDDNVSATAQANRTHEQQSQVDGYQAEAREGYRQYDLQSQKNNNHYVANGQLIGRQAESLGNIANSSFSAQAKEVEARKLTEQYTQQVSQEGHERSQKKVDECKDKIKEMYKVAVELNDKRIDVISRRA